MEYNMASLLETLMMICFGFSWPIILLKAYRARTAKATSLTFLLLIETGYVAGIAAKIIGGIINYVLAVYILNFILVTLNAIIVNEARGAVIDDKALVKALQEEKIWGAAIDTWEKEPLDPNDPLVKIEKCITTSHLGAATRETVVRCFNVGFDNILSQMNGGELRNRIV